MAIDYSGDWCRLKKNPTPEQKNQQAGQTFRKIVKDRTPGFLPKKPAKPKGRLPGGKDGQTPKKRRAARKRKKLKAAAIDRDTKVMPRFGGNCVALGISPVCTVRAEHPHELIPRGAGGPAVSWNRVPICAADHRECQGRVGGNRLVFDWPGKADGALPNADEPGNVTAKWVEHPNGGNAR